ncbi:hypothetical protein, partial [Streptomyces sp. RP5T]|uniref:hypothetical protein n=1 Tax=Streptomyces sp. RP5T TaxID=2490848 RepID=UPI001C8CEA4E
PSAHPETSSAAQCGEPAVTADHFRTKSDPANLRSADATATHRDERTRSLSHHLQPAALHTRDRYPQQSDHPTSDLPRTVTARRCQRRNGSQC